MIDYTPKYTTDVLHVGEYVRWGSTGALVRRIETKRETCQRGPNLTMTYKVSRQDYSRNWNKRLQMASSSCPCKDADYAVVQFNSQSWNAIRLNGFEKVFEFQGDIHQYRMENVGRLSLPPMEPLATVTFEEGWKMYKSGEYLAHTLYEETKQFFLVTSGTDLFFFDSGMVPVKQPEHFKVTSIPPGNRIYEFTCDRYNTSCIRDVMLGVPFERRLAWMGKTNSSVLYSGTEIDLDSHWNYLIEDVILTRKDHRFFNGEQRFVFKMKKS
jgi:hypothetical protein